MSEGDLSVRKTYIKPKKNLFEKLNSFRIEYTNEQTLFKNLAIFDFESICVREESFQGTDTTKWIGKYIPISAHISTNLVKEPVFLCNSDPHHLVTSFIGALGNLALQSKGIIKDLFFDIETTIKIKQGSTRNLPNVIIKENKQVWMITITRLVSLLSFCRSKSKSYMICRSNWNVIALFYLSLFSTAIWSQANKILFAAHSF